MIPKQHYLSEDLAFSQMDFSLVAQLSFWQVMDLVIHFSKWLEVNLQVSWSNITHSGQWLIYLDVMVNLPISVDGVCILVTRLKGNIVA
jgi:hypothetical protein